MSRTLARTLGSASRRRFTFQLQVTGLLDATTRSCIHRREAAR